MAAISAFGVTQHSQIFSFFFRNRYQFIALYQLHNSQALPNLRRGYFRNGNTMADTQIVPQRSIPPHAASSIQFCRYYVPYMKAILILIITV